MDIQETVSANPSAGAVQPGASLPAAQAPLERRIPVLGFAGYSGSGKTTLIEKLIPLLAQQGISTAVIKHDAHGLSFDTQGKDSSRFYEAGARTSLVNGPDQTAIFIHRALSVEESIAMIRDVDLILIEGYKDGAFPRIGVSRRATGRGFTADLSRFIAIACDMPPRHPPVPCFALDDAEGIAVWIAQRLQDGGTDL